MHFRNDTSGYGGENTIQSLQTRGLASFENTKADELFILAIKKVLLIIPIVLGINNYFLLAPTDLFVVFRVNDYGG